MRPLDRRLKRLEEGAGADPDRPTGARLDALHRRIVAARPVLAGHLTPADVAAEWSRMAELCEELERMRAERYARQGRESGPVSGDREERTIALFADLVALRLERVDTDDSVNESTDRKECDE